MLSITLARKVSLPRAVSAPSWPSICPNTKISTSFLQMKPPAISSTQFLKFPPVPGIYHSKILTCPRPSMGELLNCCLRILYLPAWSDIWLLAALPWWLATKPSSLSSLRKFSNISSFLTSLAKLAGARLIPQLTFCLPALAGAKIITVSPISLRPWFLPYSASPAIVATVSSQWMMLPPKLLLFICSAPQML